MRKNDMHTISLMAVLAAASVLSSSCIHKELCYDHRHLTKVVVDIDWAKAPASPTGTHVAFYNVDSPTTFYYFDMNAAGGEVEVPMGNYNVVCFNNDSETIQYRNEGGFSTYEAYTRLTTIQQSVMSAAPLPRSAVDSSQDVVICPTNFYRDMDAKVSLKENQVNYVYFQPDSAILTYTYEVIGIQNLNQATRSAAAISGVSGSLFLGEGILSSTKTTLPLETTVTTRQTKIEGSFTLFGHNADAKNYFTIYLWAASGNYYATFNVTDQMKNYPDQKHVHLIIDASNIYIPEPISEGGGIQPAVNDWEDVNEDVVL
jgi:hypothetical protein